MHSYSGRRCDFSPALTAAERRAVRSRYQLRGWLGFAALTSALLSALLSLLFYWDKNTSTIIASAILLIISLILGLVAAFITAWDIS
jgi:hypothetical protein